MRCHRAELTRTVFASFRPTAGQLYALVVSGPVSEYNWYCQDASIERPNDDFKIGSCQQVGRHCRHCSFEHVKRMTKHTAGYPEVYSCI